METYLGMYAESSSVEPIALTCVALPITYHEPQTFNEAINSADKDLWKIAMDEEMQSHYTNNTWTVVPLPSGRTCIPSGWNFRIKTDQHGQLKRRKARFFAKGYRQVRGIDFQESFAPVVRYDLLRVVLAIAASHDLELVQLDVKTAFLNGEVDEEIIAQPQGYTIVGRELEVCRLNKAIYGIRQASRIWNQKLHSVLQSFGFNQCNAYPCIYSRIGRDDTIILAI